MAYDFNANEVFIMAEQMERNGAKFYRDAAKTISDPDSREFLDGLAAMEDQHEKTFIKMKAELTEREKQETVFDPSGEGILYLHALADTRVFFEKEIDLSTLEGILKSAIEAEKDSIIFYLGMKAAVPENLGKNRLENIIQEEMGHVRLLASKLVALKK